MEPHRLRRWKPTTSVMPGHLYTCARPGRSKGANPIVPNTLIYKWAKNLVKRFPDAKVITIVSLLGRKHGPEGCSEFSFYERLFFGKWDEPSERRGRVSFQEWLDTSYEGRFNIIEHPTYDFRPIPPETLDAIAFDIQKYLSSGETVVLMDSGGETRTKAVCNHLQFIEDTTS